MKGGLRPFLHYNKRKGGLSIPDSKAKKKWVREHTIMVTIKLNHNTDADIIRKLENIPNRQGYIKSVIRQDIAKTESK